MRNKTIEEKTCRNCKFRESFSECSKIEKVLDISVFDTSKSMTNLTYDILKVFIKNYKKFGCNLFKSKQIKKG